MGREKDLNERIDHLEDMVDSMNCLLAEITARLNDIIVDEEDDEEFEIHENMKPIAGMVYGFRTINGCCT